MATEFNRRQLTIMDTLSAEGEKSVDDLVRLLGVSDMTVRRDLTLLEESGRIARTWGGARIAQRQVLDFSFRERNKCCREQKRKIGEMAASLVQPGKYVFLDTGTTALQVARSLKRRTDIRVFTCSLPIVSELLDAAGIALVLLGGTVQPDSMEVYGPLTERNFSSVKADVAFLGVDAVGPSGELLTTGMETARLSELIIQISRKRVLVADSTKWSASALVKYDELASIHTVVTDRGLPRKIRKVIRDRGVELILV